MSNTAFTEIRALLVPYANHFTLGQDTADRYVLEEDYPYSRTMFGYLEASRGGARLLFYPLNVFSELHAGLPASIAGKITATTRWVLLFKTVTAAERKALAKLFAAGWQLIQAKRALLGPDRGYFRKIDTDRTFVLVDQLLASHPAIASATRHAKDVTITFAPGVKVPAALASARKRPGVVKLKTITPAQHAALAALVATPKRA